MSEKTVSYVYDSKEHILTGRQAVRILRSGKKDVLIEIHPLDVPLEDSTYNRWVSESDLYSIED